MKPILHTSAAFERRRFTIGESALEHRLDLAEIKAAITPDRKPAPNYLLQMLDDDMLASSCQTLGQYRTELSKRLRAEFEGAPTAASIGAHTPGHITAPITPGGRAFGLIPAGKGWAEDLVNWSTREFRNPADAARIAACWNACAGLPIDQIRPAASWPDWFKVDGDAAVIYDVRYSLELLRDLGKALPEGQPFMVEKRERCGALTITKLDWAVVAKPDSERDAAPENREFVVTDPDLQAFLDAAVDWVKDAPQNMDTGLYMAELLERVEGRLAAQRAILATASAKGGAQ